uniref:Synaptobrevin, longin-like domain protein n=1 Tax=Tanacetum cinerariifolium TaxID=118510 RepID=A0A699H380_TANCI|nr:hypothetical protein [Tanacetum cinerariifolium]
MSSSFADTHNMVAILAKSDASEGFDQIIEFLNVKHSADVTRLQAIVDRKKVMISEAVIREVLHLDDAEGVDCLPNEEIFAGLAQMGYEKPSTKLTFYKAFFSSQWKFLIHTILQSLSAKRTSWNKFSSTMASAIICLSSGQKFNFSKYIFDSLVRNVDNISKFYMYPRFIQLIIQKQIGDLSTHTRKYISPALTQMFFANMRRIGKDFSGVETPLFEGMLDVREIVAEGIAEVQVQDDTAAAAIQEDVAEDVHAEDIPSLTPPTSPPPPSHDILSTSQARVKKLERANTVKTSKFRRLKKVGTSMRIDSSDEMEDVFNQERMIAELDKDEGIELVDEQVKDTAKVEGMQSDKQAEKQAEIYQLDMDHPSKVLSMQEDDSEVQEAVKVVTTAKLITEVVTAATSQVSAASATISAAKPSIPAAAPTVDKGKGIMIEKPRPMKKKDQVELDTEYARKLHEEINKYIYWDTAIDHVKQKSKENVAGYKLNYFKGMSYDDIRPIFQAKFDASMRFLLKTKEQMEEEDREALKSINETAAQKAAKRRILNKKAKEVEDLKKHLEIVPDEDDDVYTEATPLARKVPVVDY